MRWVSVSLFLWGVAQAPLANADPYDCPNDAGISCDGPEDADLCTEGVVVCTAGVGSCVGEGPLMYFPFEEGTGNVVVNAANPPIADTDPAVSGTVWADGIFSSKGMKWTGNSKVQHIRIKSVEASHAVFTWSAWVFPVTVGGTYVMSRTNSQSYNAMSFATGGEFHLNGTAHSVPSLTANIWQHVAWTYDGTTFRLYYDGVEVFFVDQAINTDWVSDVWIGQELDGHDSGESDSQSFHGLMDDLVYYGRALDATEITNLYGIGVPPQERNREICDALDNDCNPATLDPGGTPCDGSDSDACKNGTYICQPSGLLWTCGSENPSNIPELCNYKDDDCDEIADDGLGIGTGCDGPDPDLCNGGRKTCGTSNDVVCGIEPILYYTFEPTGGGPQIITDLTSWHHEGVLLDGASTGPSGKEGNGLILDGINDHARIFNTSTLRNTVNNFTMTAWIRPTSTTDGTLLYKLNSWQVVRRASDGGIAFANTSEPLATTPYYGTAPKDVWTHVVVTVNGPAVRVFINGVQVGSHNAATALGDSNAQNGSAAFIGCRGSGGWFCNGGFFEGTIDEFALFDRILHTTEIQNLYLNGTGWYAGSNEICAFGVLDDNCDGTNENAGAVGCSVYFFDGDLDGSGGQPILSLAPAGYWPMDVVTSSHGIKDWSGNGFDLTRSSGRRVAGKVGLGLELSAYEPQAGLRLTSPPAGIQLDITRAMSAGLWVFANDHGTVSDGSTFLAKANEWDFGVTATGALRLEVGGSSVTTVDSTLVTQAWHHVAFTYDQNKVTFYLDGVVAGTSNLTTPIPTTNGDFVIGHHPSFSKTNRRFDGILDEVVLFDRALNGADISTLRDGATHACLCGPIGAHVATTGGDCDDGNGQLNPQASEVCDNIDNNCDRMVDNIPATSCQPPNPQGACVEGTQSCTGTSTFCVGRPYAHFPLEEGTGSVAHSRTTTARGAHLAGATWTTGRFGNGVLLEGSNGLTIRRPPGFNTDGGVALWIKPTVNLHTTNTYLFGVSGALNQYTDLTNQLTCGVENDQLFVRTSGGLIQVPAVPHLPRNQWTHIAVTWTNAGAAGKLVSLAVNGRIIQSQLMGMTLSDGYLVLGPGANGQSLGVVDDIVVYEFAPPENILAMLANTGVPSAQDNREICDNVDNDCDNQTDEPEDDWGQGTATAGQACMTGDADACTEGSWSCDSLNLVMGCADGPIGFFNFEASQPDTAYDLAGDVPNGSLVNGAIKISEGKSGQGIRLVGTSALTHDTGSVLSLKHGSVSFFLKAEFNVNGFTEPRTLLSAGSGTSTLAWTYQSPTLMEIKLGGGADNVLTWNPSSVLKQNIWSHLTLTWDQDLDQIQLWADASIVAQRSALDWTTVGAAPATLTLGGGTAGSGGIVLDAYRLDRRALNLSEVSALQNGTILSANQNRELCDTLDNDCDNQNDENFSLGGSCDSSADSDLCEEGIRTCANLFESTCPNDGPIAYYPLSNATGNEILDLSGAHLHGERVGGVSNVAGKVGGAQRFHGVNGSIQLPDFAPFHTVSGSQTVAAWIRPASTGSTGVIFHKGGHYGLRRNADGTIAYANNAQPFCFSCNAPSIPMPAAPPNDWTHVAASWNGQTISYYMSGTKVGSAPLQGTMTDATSVPHIGCFAGNNSGVGCTANWFDGDIDELVVYDYALSDSDVLNLVTSGVPSNQRGARLCGQDQNCDGSTDASGSLDCTTYWKDGDNDGTGLIPANAFGAVAYWPFDVGSNNTVIEMITGGANGLRSHAPLRRDGARGKAVAFDGRATNSHVFGSHHNALNLNTALSLSAWIYVGDLTANTSEKPIFTKAGAYSFSLSPNGALRFEWPGVTTGPVDGPTIPTGSWQFVAVTWSKASGNVTLHHIDASGVQTANQTANLTGTGTTTPNGWGIGQFPQNGDGRRFDGMIDEVTVYGSELSATQLLDIRNTDQHACLCAPDTLHTVTTPGDCNDVDPGISPNTSELCDGIDQNCNGLTDEGANSQCDDGKSCTLDSCTTNGNCSHAILAGNCLIAGVCYGSGAQQPGASCQVCDPSVSGTQFSPRPDNTACTDGNACTSNDICLAGICAGNAVTCDDVNVCTSDTCSPQTGCIHAPLNGGTHTCYTANSATMGVGVCIPGQSTCVNGALGTCVGEITPIAELCDGVDNDCDGGTDENFGVGQACDSGDPDQCATGSMVCSGTSSAKCHSDGPVVWLPFETINNLSTPNPSWGGKNAFLQNLASGNEQVAGHTGFGKAIALDGTNDFIQLQSYSELVGTHTHFALGLWVKRNSVGQHALIAKLDTLGNVEVLLGIVNDRLVYRNGANTVDSGIHLNTIGQWQHLAVSHDATTLRFWVNGFVVRSTPYTKGTTITGSTSWTVGTVSASGFTYMPGAVDEVQLRTGTLEASWGIRNTRPSREGCDGSDSNCDGSIDEGFTLSTNACDSGDVGECATGGATVCHPRAYGTYCEGDGPSALHSMESFYLSHVLLPDAGAAAPYFVMGTPTLVPGKRGKALAFDGATHARAPILQSSTPYTLQGFAGLWVRFDAPGDMTAISKVSDGGVVELSIGRKGGALLIEALGIPQLYHLVGLEDGIWHHLAVKVAGNTVTPYVNGVPLDSFTASAALVGDTIQPPVLGAKWTGTVYGNHLVGALDEVVRFQQIPSQTVIASLVTLGEACNTIDDDCDSIADEGFEQTGSTCTGGSSCVESGTLQCNDSLTALECKGSPKPVGSSCDDSIACTKDDQCDGGTTCAGTAYVCDDGILATTDTCKGDGTCAFTPNTGVCVINGNTFSEGTINPDNACEACITAVSQGAFSPRTDGTVCSDGFVCTTGDACASGTCTGTTTVCNDANDCTVDSCQESANGCVYNPTGTDGGACDDGQPCTEDSTCAAGICSGGTAKSCDDSNPCTADACNAAVGCVNTIIPYTESCYDGPAGTKNVGACVAGTKTCTDGVLGGCIGQVIPIAELCNSKDDDCDGAADEDFPNKGNLCDSSDPDSCANGTLICSADGSELACLGDTNKPEICDLLDNDCNGLTDEGFPTLGQPCDGTLDTDQCQEGIIGCSEDGGLDCVRDGPHLLLLADATGDVIYQASDSSGLGNHGRLDGFVNFGPGQRGRAYVFDGQDDAIRIPAHASLSLGKQFTIAVSLKLAGGGQSGPYSLIESFTGSCTDLAIRLNAGGSPYALVEESNCGYASVPSGVNLSPGSWHHVALTADGTTYRLYVDGVQKGTSIQTGPPIELSDLHIGQQFGAAAKFMAGSMEEIALWPYTLNADQVQALAANGPPTLHANVEICDSLDNDCDGLSDENSSTEVCDGKDNNCDGQTDEGYPAKGDACDDNDPDQCSTGSQICNADGSATVCAKDAPLFWWRLDNGSGQTAFDYTGSGHGSIQNGIWVSGTYGNAVKLAGNGHIELSQDYASGLVQHSAAALTVETRIRITDGTVGEIVHHTGAYKLDIVSGNKVSCTIEKVGSGGTDVTAETPAITTGTWHHVACLYDGGAVRIYVDGKHRGQALSSAAGAVQSGSVLRVGSQLIGTVDEIAVWDGVLTEGALTSHANFGIPISLVTREICDLQDNDCDGSADEDFTLLGTKCDTDDADTCANGTYACTTAGNLSCNNDVPSNGIELCNGQDDDCDGDTDEDFPLLGAACDSADADLCTNGVYQCSSDGSALDCVGDSPITEICDGIDNDCDNATDEGFNVGAACDGNDLDQCQNGTLACRASATDTFCQNDGAQVFMPFNEGSGTTVTSLTGDNVTGTFVQTPVWVSGQTGSALSFGAVNDAIETPSSPENSIAGPLSFGAWIQQEAPATGGSQKAHILTKGGAQSNLFNYRLTTRPKPNSVRFDCELTGTSPNQCSTQITESESPTNLYGIFHHVMCVYDGSKMHIYYDGKAVKSCTMTGTPVTNDEKLFIGNLATSNGGLSITLDDVQIWNQAITTSQVASTFTGGDACDDLDNDCDGLTDEGFPTKTQACDGPDDDLCTTGGLTCSSDGLGLECTGDTLIVESCNELDDDCDGLTDEDFTDKNQPCDGSDSDSCKNGTFQCSLDGQGLSCGGDLNQPEICDGLDNDCNGTTDDNIQNLGQACEDTDADQCQDGLTYCNSTLKSIACDEVKSVLWLPFEEAAGATHATDSSRFQRSTLATNATFGATGKLGSAVRFDVAGRLLDHTNAFDQLSGKSAATWSTWVRHEGPFVPGASQTIIALWSTGAAPAKNFALRILSNGLELALRTTGDAGETPTSYRCIPGVDGCTALISPNTWFHVAAVLANGELRFYVNGVLVRAQPTVGTTIAPKQTGDFLSIGADDGAGTNALHGALDSVALFDRALSEAEIAQLLAVGPNGDQPELCNGLDDDCDTVADNGIITGTACDGADGDQCQSGALVCNGAGTGTVCDDSSTLLYWPAEEGAGIRVVDHSGGGRDAILFHDATFTSDAKVGTGALKFVASSTAHGQGPNVDVIGGKSKVSFSAWIKPNSIAPGTEAILSTHGVFPLGLGRTWAVGRNGDGLFLRIRVVTNSAPTPKTLVCNSSTGCNALLSAGVWAHIAITVSTGTVRFYVNGTFIKGFLLGGGTLANKHADERLLLGTDMAGELGFFDGTIDEIEIHDKALSQTEVATHFNQTQGLGWELCNELDDDCDGQADEDFVNKDQPCDGIDTDQCMNGTWTCAADATTLECTNETTVNLVENCNNLDDDCDGQTDEDYPTLNTACDGADADQCLEGKFSCNTDGTGVSCQRDGPSHLWRVETGTGTVVQDTASNLAPQSLMLNSVGWTSGKFGNGLDFDGLAGQSATSTVNLSGTKTVTFWMKPDESANSGYVYSQATDSKLDFNGFWTGGALIHTQQDGSTQHILSGPVTAGTWHHIAIVMEPGIANGLRLYIDCVLQQPTPLITANTASAQLQFGSLVGSTQTFTGHLDEIAVFDHAVTPATLCVHAATGIPVLNENREICDAQDNDCNGGTDDGLAGIAATVCDGPDADSCATGTWTCQADRLDAECVNESDPNHSETCNSVDDDCDGLTDEDFTYSGQGVGKPCTPPGICSPGAVECISTTEAGCSTGPAGSASETGPEVCDNKDNDCDGSTDEKPDGSPVTQNCYTGPDGTVGIGLCQYGQRECVAGAYGPCLNDVIPEASDADCDGVDEDCSGQADDSYQDGIACTIDSCEGGVATSTPSDANCDDGNPCTTDTCLATTEIPGCQYVANDNNVPDAATYGIACHVPICQAGNIVQSVDDTLIPDDGLSCTTDVCLNGNDVHTIHEGFCKIENTCYAAGAVNTESGCKVCAPEYDAENWSKFVHIADFDKGGGNVDGYTDSELVGGSITWGPSPLFAANGGFSYYFGNGATGTYDSGARVKATATSPLMRLPAGVRVQLSFSLLMETEGYTGSQKYDTLFVHLREESTGSETLLWESMSTLGNNTSDQFKRLAIDLSEHAGKDVRILFTFDSGDAFFNDYKGVYLDQIRVRTGCCLLDTDCADGVNCTGDFCVDSKCVYQDFCSTCVPAQTTVAVGLQSNWAMNTVLQTGETYWQAATTGLINISEDYDQQVNMGLKTFPQASDGSSPCSLETGLSLDFHSSTDLISSFLSGISVVSSPVAPIDNLMLRLLEVYQYPGVYSQTGSKFVILFIANGWQTCTAVPTALTSIGSLRSLGIRTIVIAADATFTATEKEGANALALAGGMARPLTTTNDKIYISASDATTFQEAWKTAFDMTVRDACDGIDSDCDGTVDQNAPELGCNLACNSGQGGTQTCIDGNYSPCSEFVIDEICDGKDNDCDGTTDEEWSQLGKPCSVGAGECFSVGQYICPSLGTGSEICNAPPKVGIPEICNSKDDDCDGLTDEDLSQVCTTACGTGTEICTDGAFVGCTAVAATDEVCNGLDDDCNNTIDDIVPIPCTGACGDGFQVCAAGQLGGCSASGTEEVCDTLDNDCDGKTDEGTDDLPLTTSCVIDTQLTGACAVGTRTCADGTFGGCIPNQLPIPEICDGVDNDCDGKTDNTEDGSPVTITCYDGAAGTAGVGECKSGLRTCLGDGTLGTECVGQVQPLLELCDGKDNDCNGSTDENPGSICVLEPGCASGACLCGKGDDGIYKCFLD